MKAWRVFDKGTEVVSYVFATTRGRATSLVMGEANSLGFDIEWTDLQTKRAAQFDGLYNPNFDMGALYTRETLENRRLKENDNA